MLRRSFLSTLAVTPTLGLASITQAATNQQPASAEVSSGKPATPPHKLKLSLNAYSFNVPLRDKTMSLDDMLEFCANAPIQAVDITGYYFPGYPAVPTNEYINHIKQKAFRVGLDISGTGVRNDFTDPDKNKRKADVQLVKDWIEVAAKLGAPVIRIFAGTKYSGSSSSAPSTGGGWGEAAERMMEDVRTCVEYGKQFGVMVGIQNHNDFIKTADHVHTIFKMYSSEWFGLILDNGSYRSGDPYQQIADTTKYAINWQLKENIFVNGTEQPADIDRIINIIKASGYRGYLPIETLGPGDPKVKVPAFVEKVQKALEQ
jgi:sugar phosphate isomerase/epimerase